MDERKTIFDYLAQVLFLFGFVMLTLNVFCLLVGDSAKEVSALFALGSQGVPAEVACQFLGLSALIAGLRVVFFKDTLIQKLSLGLRVAGMLSSIILIIVFCVIRFHWFPIDLWQSWAMFLLCFGICFLGSYWVMISKEKAENRQMEEALQKLKSREGKNP